MKFYLAAQNPNATTPFPVSVGCDASRSDLSPEGQGLIAVGVVLGTLIAALGFRWLQKRRRSSRLRKKASKEKPATIVTKSPLESDVATTVNLVPPPAQTPAGAEAEQALAASQVDPIESPKPGEENVTINPVGADGAITNHSEFRGSNAIA